MKLKFFTFLSLFFIQLFFAQQTIIGVVLTEDNHRVPNVKILNTTTNQVFVSDEKGQFLISAKPGNTLRFVKKRYERLTFPVTSDSFAQNVKIVMKKSPINIKEVKIKYRFNGNLAKDVKYLNESKKKRQLNEYLNDDIARSSMASNRKDMRDFEQNSLPKYQSGAASVNVVDVLGKVVSLFSKREQYHSTVSSKNLFLKRLKSKVNTAYYQSLGMSDYDIERFLAFADERFQLEEKFHGDVENNAIQGYLDKALLDFPL